MFWITETPTVITNKDNYILPILKKPIYWTRGISNPWAQYGMYMQYIAKQENFYMTKLFNVYHLELNSREKIRIGRTKLMPNPKLIVLYCHTVFGSYKELSHLANEFRNDPVVYFSYSRKGVHKELHADNYSVVGCLDTLDAVINHIQTLFPTTPIHAIGVSAGSCLLTRYMALRNQSKKIKSSVLISPGFNFMKSISLMSHYVQEHLLNKLKLSYSQCVSDRMLNANTLMEWADAQYDSTHHTSRLEYLLESDPVYMTKRINVPTIMISALDDFCFPGVITEESTNLPYENKNITMVITKMGGHISFLDYNATIPWSSRVAIEHIRCKLTML
jgi:pimeloyl-ACP methyl ester carboxylesterase